MTAPDRPAPEPCGCHCSMSGLEEHGCLYPATVERLREADKALKTAKDQLARALDVSYERRERLRIAQEALNDIASCSMRHSTPGAIAREALERKP